MKFTRRWIREPPTSKSSYTVVTTGTRTSQRHHTLKTTQMSKLRRKFQMKKILRSLPAVHWLVHLLLNLKKMMKRLLFIVKRKRKYWVSWTLKLVYRPLKWGKLINRHSRIHRFRIFRPNKIIIHLSRIYLIQSHSSIQIPWSISSLLQILASRNKWVIS
jgi:hypothetical protein